MPSVMSHPARKRASPQKVLLARARFWRKPVRVELPQRKSELHPKRFSPSRCDFNKNPFGWSFPSAKVSSTRKGFACPEAFLTKTRAGGASPTQKRGTNKNLVLAPTRSRVTNRAHVRGWWFRQAQPPKLPSQARRGLGVSPSRAGKSGEVWRGEKPPLRK